MPTPIGFRVQIAACLNDKPAIDHAVAVTGQRVVDEAGIWRRSDVQWRMLNGREAAMRVVTDLYAGRDSANEIATVDQLRAFFDEHPNRGRLIVALCRAVGGG